MSARYPNEWQEMTFRFHQAMGLPNGDDPRDGVDNLGIIDGRLMLEEPTEAVLAMFGKTIAIRLLMEQVERVLGMKEVEGTVYDRLPEIVDGLGDSIYIAAGRASKLGVDLAPIMREIHRANMAKAGGPIVNQKQQKPPGWTPPDIAGELRKQGW